MDDVIPKSHQKARAVAVTIVSWRMLMKRLGF